MSSYFFFLKIVLAILCPLQFHIHFTSFSVCTKKSVGDSDRDCIESVDQFEEHCYLNTIVFQSVSVGGFSIYLDLLSFYSVL